MTNFCPECFKDKGLRRRIEEVRPQYDDGACSIHPRRKGVPIEAIAAIVDEVFRANFTFGDVDWYDDPDDPGAHGPQKGQPLRETIWAIADPIDDEVANALVDQLIEDDAYLPQDGDEPFYVEDSNYDRIDGEGGHDRLWRQFCHTVTHEQRFLNPRAGELLGELFKHIHLQYDQRRNCPVYRLAPAHLARLHRARVVTPKERADIQDDPGPRLGPAPRRLGKSNRMNPSGIPAFYGSFDLATCISELRPLVGAEVVAGEFEVARDLVVLDTTRFAAPPKELNLFARDHVRRLTQWRFMQRLMSEIAKPISQNDEHIDYVPTQFVAEYLNKAHEVRIGRERVHIDAIIYRSAQRPAGKNIVILGAAARVVGDAKRKGPRSFPSLALDLDWDDPPDPGLVYLKGSLKIMTIMAADFPADVASLWEGSISSKLRVEI